MTNPSDPQQSWDAESQLQRVRRVAAQMHAIEQLNNDLLVARAHVKSLLRRIKEARWDLAAMMRNLAATPAPPARPEPHPHPEFADIPIRPKSRRKKGGANGDTA